MIEVYNTDTKKPRPLGHDGVHYEVKLNEDVIIWRIANEIYQNPLSGARELVANGITAIENAISMGILRRDDALLSVHVTEDRQLVISDNGTGITMEVLDKVLRVMGNSSNFDGKNAGKFGMGFFAFTTLSSSVIIDTVAHDGTRFSAVCTDGRAFDVFESTRRKERGTTITLSLYNGEKYDGISGSGKRPVISVPAVLEMAGNIALASKIPITITCGLVDENPGWMPSGRADYDGSGIAKMAAMYERHSARPVFLAKDGVEVAILFNNSMPKSEVFLAGMPVDRPRGLPNGLVVNAADEREYEPMPNRESLTEKAGEKLVEKVLSMVSAEFEKTCGIRDLQTYQASGQKERFHWIIDHGDAYYPDEKGGPGRRARIAEDMGNWCFVNELGHPSTLNAILSSKRPSVCKSIQDDVGSAIEAAGSNITRFAYNGPTGDGERIAKRWKVPSTGQLLQEDGIVISDRDRLNKIWARTTIHTNFMNYDRKKRAQLGDEIDIVMMTGGAWRIVRQYIRWQTDPDTAFITYNKKLANDGTITYEEWMDGVMSTTVTTNHGEMTLSEFFKRDKIAEYVDDPSPRERSMIMSSRKTILLGGISELKIMLASAHAGRMIDDLDESDLLGEQTGFVIPMRLSPAVRGIPKDLDGPRKTMINNILASCKDNEDVDDVGKMVRFVAGIAGPMPREKAAMAWHVQRAVDAAPRAMERLLSGELSRMLGFDPFELPGFRESHVRAHLGRQFADYELSGEKDGTYQFTGTVGPKGASLDIHWADSNHSITFSPGCRIRADKGRVTITGTVTL